MTKRYVFILLMILACGNLHAAPRKSMRSAPKIASRPAAKPVAKPVSAAESYQRGYQLLKDGKFAEASVELKKAADTGTAPALVYFLLGEAYRFQGKTLDADVANETFLDKASPRDPVEVSIARGILLARIRSDNRWQRQDAVFKDFQRYFRLVDNPLADMNLVRDFQNYMWQGPKYAPDIIKTFKDLLQRYPQDKQIPAMLGSVYATGNGAEEESSKFLHQQTEQRAGDPMAWRDLAVYETHKEHYDKALPLFEKAMQLGLEKSSILPELTQVYQKMGRLDDALSTLQESYRQQRNSNSRAYIGGKLFDFAKQANRMADLRKFLEADLAENPDDVHDLGQLTVVLKQLGDNAAYQTRLAKFLSTAQDPYMMDALAASMNENGNPEVALLLYWKVMAINPNTGAEWRVGDIIANMIRDGKGKEVHESFHQFAETSKVSPDRIASLCLRLMDRNCVSEAEDLAKEALQKSPDNSALQRVMATILSKQGRLTEALTMLRKLLPTSKDGSVATTLCDVAEKAGQMREIIPDLQAAIVNRSSDAQLHRALGRAYLSVKEYSSAVDEYKRADQLGPGDRGAMAGLAQAYEGAGNDIEAAKTWQAAMEMSQDRWSRRECIQRLVPVWKRSGKVTEGIDILKKNLIANPGDPYLSKGIADLYIIAKRPQDAIPMWIQAFKGAQDEWECRELSDQFITMCQSNNLAEKGIESLRGLTGEPAKEAVFQSTMGQLYVTLNRPDDAVQCYIQSVTKNPDMYFQVQQRLLWELHQPELALNVFTSITPKDQDQAQRFLDCIDSIMQRVDEDASLRLVSVKLSEKAKQYLDGIQAKYSGTDLAAHAAQLSVHCSIRGRMASAKGDARTAEGARIISELEEIQRLYPNSRAAGDAAVDIMGVYETLHKDTERDAIQAKIISGQYGNESAINALRNRGQRNSDAKRYKEAISDWSNCLELLEKAPNLKQQYVRYVKMDLAQAYFASGDDDNAKKLANEVLSLAAGERSLIRRAQGLLHGGLQARLAPQRERTYVVSGDEVTPESAAELTEKIHTSLLLRAPRPDPVSVNLQMAIAPLEGMTIFPSEGNSSIVNGKRLTAWQMSMAPSGLDEWQSKWFGYKRTVPNSPQPIKGLRVKRSCVQESPGEWLIKLSVSAEQNVMIQLYNMGVLDFTEAIIESSTKANSVGKESIQWGYPWNSDNEQPQKLDVTIHAKAQQNMANFTPRVQVSAMVVRQTPEADAREDSKTAIWKDEYMDLTLTTDKDFSLEYDSAASRTVVELPGRSK